MADIDLEGEFFFIGKTDEELFLVRPTAAHHMLAKPEDNRPEKLKKLLKKNRNS